MESKVTFNLEKNLLNTIHNSKSFIEELQFQIMQKHDLQSEINNMKSQEIQLQQKQMILQQKVKLYKNQAKIYSLKTDQIQKTVKDITYQNMMLQQILVKANTIESQDKLNNLIVQYNQITNTTFDLQVTNKQQIKQESDQSIIEMKKCIQKSSNQSQSIEFYQTLVNDLYKQIQILQQPTNQVLETFANKLESINTDLKNKNKLIEELMQHKKGKASQHEQKISQLLVENDKLKQNLAQQDQQIKQLSIKVDSHNNKITENEKLFEERMKFSQQKQNLIIQQLERDLEQYARKYDLIDTIQGPIEVQSNVSSEQNIDDSQSSKIQELVEESQSFSDDDKSLNK